MVMKKALAATLSVAMLLNTVTTVAAKTESAQNPEFQSESVVLADGTTRDYEIALPADYDTSNQNYPVVYLFPEDGLSEYSGNLLESMTDITNTGDAIDMIFVKTAFEKTDDFRAVTEDIINDVDATYNTIAEAPQRAAFGMEVGGYMAYMATLTTPNADDTAYEKATSPVLFGSVASVAGDFVSDKNIWTGEGDVYDIIADIGKKDIKNFYTYLDSASFDPNSSMKHSTNDIGSLVIGFSDWWALIPYTIHEFTSRYGAYDEAFVDESISRVMNRFSIKFQTGMTAGSLEITPQIATSDLGKVEASYKVNVSELFSKYSAEAKDLDITVSMTDPVTGAVLHKNTVNASVSGTDEISGTIEIPNLVNGKSTTVGLTVSMFGYDVYLAEQSLIRVQDTGSAPDEQLIDLMGDWNFNAYKPYSDTSANSLDNVQNVTKDIWNSWGIVQPGLGWWSEDFDSSLGGNANWGGYAWYVREFYVPADFADENLVLALGSFDEADTAYINGVEIGSTGIKEDGTYDGSNPWDANRVYKLDSSALKYGETNTIYVRMCNSSGGGGWYTGPIGVYSKEAYNKAAGLPSVPATGEKATQIKSFVEAQLNAIIAKDIESYSDTVSNEYFQGGFNKDKLLEKTLAYMVGDGDISASDADVFLYVEDGYYIYQANRTITTASGETITFAVNDFYTIDGDDVSLYGDHKNFYSETYSSGYAASAQGSEDEKVDMNFLIYLPENYFDSDERYPVVYLLHQLNSTSNSYALDNINGILDETIANGDMRDMIVVMPDSSAASGWRGDWEDMVTEDLVPYINANYRTVEDARFQGTAGCSMGGGGAYNIALNNPNKFANIVSFYGAFNPETDPITTATNTPSYMEYFNQFFVSGNRDFYKFGQEAVLLDQMLNGLDVSHYFAIGNGGHDSAFYVPLFDDALMYINKNMYSADASILDAAKGDVTSEIADGIIKIKADVAISDAIADYLNSVPSSSFTLETKPNMVIPVTLKIVQGDKTVYATTNIANSVDGAATFAVEAMLTELQMRDIDLDADYKVEAIASLLDQNVVLDTINVEAEDKDDTSKPDTSEPDTSEPDTSKPEVSEPDTSKPEVSEPDTSKPEVSVPDADDDTSTEDSDSPDTSDNTTGFALVAFMMSIIGLGAVVILRKKAK